MKIFEITFLGITIAPSYYGLMYAIGFILCYNGVKKTKILNDKQLDNLLIYTFFGVILGGRIGYVLFYDLAYYISNPSEIFKIWKGGMSFHGGAMGVIISSFIFSYKEKVSIYKITDSITYILPLALMFGRMGNYINKELLGFEYYGLLAVEKGGVSYFPTPLVEALFEGLILYLILKYIYKNSKKPGETSGYFLMLYGIFRIFIEFVRLPDVQIGYIYGIITMGQILSIPMIIFGAYFAFFNTKKGTKNLYQIH